MQHVARVAIDRVDETLEYKERRSPWIDQAYRDLKKVVKKAGTVRIVARKVGADRYMVVVGHHLLKAAKECGLRDVDLLVMDVNACQTTREDLLVFRLGVEEILLRAMADPL